jgi:hypothetical protein
MGRNRGGQERRWNPEHYVRNRTAASERDEDSANRPSVQADSNADHQQDGQAGGELFYPLPDSSGQSNRATVDASDKVVDSERVIPVRISKCQ